MCVCCDVCPDDLAMKNRCGIFSPGQTVGITGDDIMFILWLLFVNNSIMFHGEEWVNVSSQCWFGQRCGGGGWVGWCWLSAINCCYITLTSQWTWWRLKPPASGLFTQLFIHVQITESIKIPRHWSWWRLKSPALRLFIQPFLQTQIKNIKAPRRWPLCWEFTGDRWIPRTKGQ